MGKLMKSCLLIAYKSLSPTPSTFMDMIGGGAVKKSCRWHTTLQMESDILTQLTKRRIWISARILGCDSMRTLYTTSRRRIPGKETTFYYCVLRYLTGTERRPGCLQLSLHKVYGTKLKPCELRSLVRGTQSQRNDQIPVRRAILTDSLLECHPITIKIPVIWVEISGQRS